MRIIICGFGVVGQSLAKLIESRSEDLYARYGIKARIVGVADSGGSATDPSGLDPERLVAAKKAGSVRGYPGAGGGLTGGELIEGLDADVMIETTVSDYTNAEPGTAHITGAMGRGMHVISVNKGPLALSFPSLTELAEYNRVMLRFSGTVGGGTPILDFAKKSLRGERITSFAGILNGTTNYILTGMAGGSSYEEALADAKGRGYVERNEALDLDGLDAAAKLVILANWVMGMKVTLGDVDRTGIRNVDTGDIREAAAAGSAVKLVATCDGGLRVAPERIPVGDPLCVDGTLNAVAFTSEHSGTQTIIGRGAGGIETASSIIRDLLDIRAGMARE
ncbi:homoserine dehydrogenase [Cenarchaeum symbiosum A]|uniref:Homoserine dehydrogenase n=1 Tax=Cenarchaeum symbiosum (strain A) TaxID=414004 RepID=A0RU88_CENSY|nr:homoserine dehydrogenase [Cenarchaeum symbiosum A]